MKRALVFILITVACVVGLIYIRGASGKILYLGFLFFQSQQGIIFTIVVLALLALFLYAREVKGGMMMTIQRGTLYPIILEVKNTNSLLTRKIESAERKIDLTEQALQKFSTAIELYISYEDQIQESVLQAHRSKISISYSI